jgi:hypothetical protein
VMQNLIGLLLTDDLVVDGDNSDLLNIVENVDYSSANGDTQGRHCVTLVHLPAGVKHFM